MDKPFKTIIRLTTAIFLSAMAVANPGTDTRAWNARGSGAEQLNNCIITQFANVAYDSSTAFGGGEQKKSIQTGVLDTPVWCSVSNREAPCTNTDSTRHSNVRTLASILPIHPTAGHEKLPHPADVAMPQRHPVETARKEAEVQRELDNFTLTAYSLDFHSTGKWPSSPGFGITASGSRATVGRTVAVDPTIIPIGTKLMIEGIGARIAEDTGGAVKGRHIDILLPNEAAAYEFGVRHHVRIYVEGMPK